jgi:dihydroneopterin aldolase
MDVLKLERIMLYGKHGVYSEENTLGQRFIISVEIHLDLSVAGQTDRLEETINYTEIYGVVKKIVQGKPCALIETVAEKIASSLLDDYDKINLVKISVTKPHPPIDITFDGVTAEITRRRES